MTSRTLIGAALLALGFSSTVAAADTIFNPPTVGFPGSVSARAAGGGALHAGDTITISGQRLIPGQQVTVLRGTTALNDTPVTVDAEGKFSLDYTLDAEATPGLHPLTVVAQNPDAAVVTELKISPKLAPVGAENWVLTGNHVNNGLYQVAYSAANRALFVSAAVGRPPIKEASLSKVDAATLAVLASVAPAAAPARPDGSDGGLFGHYGIGVDDAHGHVWTTNTRQNTLAVYRQSDLGLVKQFAPGTVTHARDVVIDSQRGRAYASATGTGNIHVFDTATLEELDPIVLTSGKRGAQFSAMALDLDVAAGKLATVSMGSEEVALIDLTSGESRVFPLAGAKSASGVAYDAQQNLLFVASQATDNLLIVNAADGSVLHDIKVGAGPLNVTFEPVSRLAFVAVRSAGTVVAVDTDGNVVANLALGQLPNQLRADGLGNVHLVNQGFNAEAGDGDQIWKIAPRKN